ncbi:arginine decarboxylase, pyruvoyl-dependent [Candidatus Micrarchaeota archaeon]|nr:arginine decarboxylase, pyruvoyl-dependent [Candidatus Micrarchaeota archaeon]
MRSVSVADSTHVPKKVFFTKGVGTHRDKLTSFELALRDAGIERFNLVMVSSILPPHCEIVPKAKGLPMLKDGEIVFVVLSRNESNEHNRLICASVGAAIPADRSQYGYLSEYHSFGETDAKAGDYAEDLAASMLASTLGIEFDLNQGWDEKEALFKMSGKIVKTTDISQSVVVDKQGEWTSVVAAAVFVLTEHENQPAEKQQNSRASYFSLQ